MEGEIIRAFDGFRFFQWYWGLHFVFVFFIAVKCALDIIDRVKEWGK